MEYPQRHHHYSFAHEALYQICLNDTEDFFDAIYSEDQKDFLAWIWELVIEHCGDPPDSIDMTELKVTTCNIENLPAIVIEMPTPIAITEAYAVGIVLLPKTKGKRRMSPRFRYFTLELSFSLFNEPEDKPSTVLGEWRDKDVHINYGRGPSPSLDNFVQSIQEKLKKKFD